MSFTISKSQQIPVLSHNKNELVIITCVYNTDGRLTINVNNTCLDCAIPMLARSISLLSGYTGDEKTIIIDHFKKEVSHG